MDWEALDENGRSASDILQTEWEKWGQYSVASVFDDAIAKHFSIKPNSVRGRRSRLGLVRHKRIDGCLVPVVGVPQERQPSVASDYRELIEAEKNRIIGNTSIAGVKKVLAHVSRKDLIADILERRITALPQTPAVVPVQPATKQDEDLVIVLADTHIGSTTDSEYLHGASVYSTDIFLSDLNKALGNLERSIEGKKYANVHIWLMGDMVSGSGIFPGQQHETDLCVVDQTLLGGQVIAKMVARIAAVTNSPVEVHCVPGNHGRHADASVRDNWDTVLYNVVRMLLENHSNIKVNVTHSMLTVVPVGGMKFLLMHGFQIPGTSPPTIERMVIRYKEIYGYDIGGVIIGHYHSLRVLRFGRTLFVGSPAFSPPTSYSIKKLGLADPSALLTMGISNGRVQWLREVRPE